MTFPRTKGLKRGSCRSESNEWLQEMTKFEPVVDIASYDHVSCQSTCSMDASNPKGLLQSSEISITSLIRQFNYENYDAINRASALIYQLV